MAIPDWLTLSQLSGSGDTIITVTASTNEELTDRIGSLVISGNTKSVTVPVTSMSHTFSVSPTVFNLPSRSGSTTMRIDSDYPWAISPATTDICQFSPSSGTGPATVTVNYFANTTGALRSATTTVSGWGTSAITINQSSAGTISVSPNSTSVGGSGGTINATVISLSGVWYFDSASAPNVTAVPSSGTGTTSQSVVLTVAPNYTGGTATTFTQAMFYDGPDFSVAERAQMTIMQSGSVIVVYYTSNDGQPITPPTGWTDGGYGRWYRNNTGSLYGVNVSGNTSITSIESAGRILLNCKDCSNLVYVDTPNGMANTNSAMFSGCTSLTGITCATYTIMVNSFRGDYNLKRFVSTYNSTSNPIYVEAGAFQGCTSLEYLEFRCPRDAQIYPGSHPFNSVPAGGTLVRPSGYDYSAISNELSYWVVQDL